MNRKPRYYRRPFLLSVLTTLMVLAVTQLLVYEQYTLLKERKQQRLVRELNNAEGRLKGILLSDVTAADALAAFYKYYGLNGHFDNVTRDIMSRNSYVEVVRIKDNGKIKYAYPPSEAENSMIQIDPRRLREALNALERNEINFEGPREMTSGDTCILSEAPIITEGKLTASVSVLTKLSTIVRALKLADSNKSQFAYQLRKTNTRLDTSNYLLTVERPARQSPTVSTFIPEGSWRLSVSYSDNVAKDYSLLSISFLGILLSAVAGVFAYRRLAEPDILREVIDDKTKDLTKSLAKLDRNNKELALLNSINDIIIKAKTEAELYKEVCNCLVYPGRYKLAWIAHRPDVLSKDQTIVPLEAAGAVGYLRDIKIVLDDPTLAKGPTAQCLLTGKSIVTNNVADATYFVPWCETAKKFGFASSMALALNFGTEYVGSLAVYSGKVDAFAPHEVKILERLAANLSQAVRTIRLADEQKHAEEEIRGLNADLENRVQQRTQEVNKLNEVLKSNIRDLEIANSDLESFNYSVSHDLRAPLRSINGFASLMGKRSSTLSDESKKFLTLISDNAKKMDKLIEELLAFARAGRKELEQANLDMNAMLSDVLSEINIHEWNADTKVITTDLLPANGDAVLIKQLLFNLVSNAVKYSRKKDQPVIEVGSYTSGNENTYFVRDNGAGFNMSYYNKLFKVFQRMHSTDEFEGTGVGLAIVQRIAMKHGGKVWAEAKEGEGATFYFTLPPSNNEANTIK